MEEREFQKELFDEFVEGKRRLTVPRGLLARPLAVTLSLERLVFIGIGALMALIVVYALGVERGKAIAKREGRRAPLREQWGGAGSSEARARETPSAVSQMAPDAAPLAPSRDVASQPRAVTPPATTAPETPSRETAPSPLAADQNRPYSLLLVTFKQKSYAEREVAKLKGEGYTAFSFERGEYVEVYAGRFSTAQDTARLQNALRARYRDCAIRKLL